MLLLQRGSNSQQSYPHTTPESTSVEEPPTPLHVHITFCSFHYISPLLSPRIRVAVIKNLLLIGDIFFGGESDALI